MNDFLSPSAIWGLLGLIIPIIIHLLSKKKKKEIFFGSIQFLEETPSNSARSIRLSDLPLLLIRCFLFALTCFLTAQYLLKDKDKSKYYWIQDQVLESEYYDNFLNVLNSEIAVVPFSLDSGRLQSIWTWIDKANTQEDSIEIICFNRASYFKGPSVNIQTHVKLNALPIRTAEEALQLINKENSSTEWQLNESSINRMSYANKVATNNGVSPPLRLYYSTRLASPLLKDLIEEIALFLPYPVTWTDDTSEADWVITNLTDQYVSTQQSIRWNPNEGQLELEPLIYDHYELSGLINRTNLLDSNLPASLSKLFNQSYLADYEYDNRSFNQQELAYASAAISADSTRHPIHQMWWLLIIPLLLIERYMSHKTIDS